MIGCSRLVCLQSNRAGRLHSKGTLPHASSHRVCDCCAVDELQAQLPELERLAKLAKPKLVKLAKPTRRQTVATSAASTGKPMLGLRLWLG